ncbi:DNA polymerase family X lyase domain [Phytophthora cinnamomi]|uniref:DNA polymerase family X lyase domain n=1 Tax=Phytophthora cinnamomi TaxID=4785 RepID=UPI00355975D8|nr:DNA polymerase family X lyase domain [Phytophthora cinnamomi]
MKAETAISDLLMKCEEQGVQLPENPWQALRETISALRNTKHRALGYLQIPKAMEQLKTKFSAAEAKQVAAAASPRLVRRQKRALMQDMPSKRSRRNTIPESDSDSDEDSSNQAGLVSAMSPVASSKKTKYQKKSRLQEQVEALPAARDENQPLVDQLVQLGEYEMHHGHSQRGLSRFRAAKEIRDSRMVITSGAQAKQLERVGAAVATKVDQLLNEGLAAALGEYEGDEEALPVEK